MLADEELRNAEIQQLGDAIGCHQDIVRLQIPVHNQPPVCVLDCVTNGEKDLQSVFNGAALMIAEFINPFSLHILHGKVRHPLRRCPAVKKPRNVRMIQPGESSALKIEPSDELRGQCAQTHYLERNPAVRPSIIANGLVYLPHSAPAQQANNTIGTDARTLVFQLPADWNSKGICEKRTCVRVGCEKREKLGGEAGILRTERGDERPTLFSGQGDRFREKLFEAICSHAQATRVLLRN
jgi:hypothetical protein